VAVVLAACGGPAASSQHADAPPTTQAPATTTTAAPPTTTTSACNYAAVVASWTVTQRAEQLVVVPAEETDVAQIAPAVRDGVGGVILFGSTAPADLGTQLARAESGAPGGLKPLVMTDEEGGEVQRMANLVGSLPWPRTMAGSMSVSQVQSLAESTARAMAANGVTMDLAPVLDLASGPGPDAQHTDGPRSFSIDPTVASEYGIAFARGLQAGGVIPVVKHFPGEGSATANTDDGPASTPPLAQLQRADLLPFEAAIKTGLPAVMVGNATVPGLTSMPASLSSSVIQGLLQDQLGFNGLVITDSLSAGAISDIGISVDQAAVDAIAAGADMVLFNSNNPVSDSQSIVQHIVDAVGAGTIPQTRLDAAVDEVVTAKHSSLC
jgi:beta-N-acetylhexosaminidase